jgi:hypothetical protein
MERLISGLTRRVNEIDTSTRTLAVAKTAFGKEATVLL